MKAYGVFWRWLPALDMLPILAELAPETAGLLTLRWEWKTILGLCRRDRLPFVPVLAFTLGLE